MSKISPIFIFFILLLNGCPVPIPQYYEPKYSKLGIDPQGITDVTFVYVQNPKSDSTMWHPTAYLFIDGKHFARLEDKQYTKIKVTLKKHVAEIQWFELGHRAPLLEIFYIKGVGPIGKSKTHLFNTETSSNHFVIFRCLRSDEGNCNFSISDTGSWANATRYLENYTFIAPGDPSENK